MENDKFLDQIDKTFQDAAKLIRAKNQDYASPLDPYKNFRGAAIIGVDSFRAILVRVADKLSRISNLLDRENVVKGEGNSISDDLLDSINYLCLLKVWLENKEYYL